MELVGQYQKQYAISLGSIRLPWFGWMALSLLSTITIIVIGVIMAGHRETANPFSAFSDLFGDDARQAALARGFTCRDMVSRSHPQTPSGYCAQRNTDEMFSGIFLRMLGDIANEVSFSLREDTLMLGDLVLLWGQPEIRLYCEVIVASWPAHRITSLLAAPRTERATNFMPVLSISFARGSTPQWGKLLRNDALHNCG